MDRIFVCPEDVCKLTGNKKRYAQKLIREIKILLNKKKHQYITKRELADYLGISEEDIDLT
ncbi:MAG: hypothetical protein EOO01_02520 [Chitinophagaceae bacterium]|nr:MAG: hypothetical protein EOO01_02520 [Chitinophagaceae bacterium]